MRSIDSLAQDSANESRKNFRSLRARECRAARHCSRQPVPKPSVSRERQEAASTWVAAYGQLVRRKHPASDRHPARRPQEFAPRRRAHFRRHLAEHTPEILPKRFRERREIFQPALDASARGPPDTASCRDLRAPGLHPLYRLPTECPASFPAASSTLQAESLPRFPPREPRPAGRWTTPRRSDSTPP